VTAREAATSGDVEKPAEGAAELRLVATGADDFELLVGLKRGLLRYVLTRGVPMAPRELVV
jgi:hypothetical protein